MTARLYRIICLKRSECKMEDGYFRWSKPVYWMPRRAGYTEDPQEAGIYSGGEMEDCAGCKGDWLLEPVSSAERFPILHPNQRMHKYNGMLYSKKRMDY